MSGQSGVEPEPAPTSKAEQLQLHAEKEQQQAAQEEDGTAGEEAPASTSGRSEPDAATKTPCAFYMRTGTCAYVSAAAAVGVGWGVCGPWVGKAAQHSSRPRQQCRHSQSQLACL